MHIPGDDLHRGDPTANHTALASSLYFCFREPFHLCQEAADPSAFPCAAHCCISDTAQLPQWGRQKKLPGGFLYCRHSGRETAPAPPGGNGRPGQGSCRAHPQARQLAPGQPTPANCFSRGVRGAIKSARVSDRVCVGAGSARRSIFPLDMSGSALSVINAAGSMYPGNLSCRKAP